MGGNGVTEEAKLKHLSICPCGNPCLMHHIQIGTVYHVDRGTVRRGYVYRCGKCGRRQLDVACVMASQQVNADAPMMPLPAGLFWDEYRYVRPDPGMN